jgi:hypothetical protein
MTPISKFAIAFSFLFLGLSAESQILKGIGVYGALTQSMHSYKNRDADKRQFTTADFDANPNFYNTTNYISKERFSWGAGVFLEFARRSRYRWQTELEYANKGSKERDLVNPFLVQRSDNFATNAFTYFQWNNYLKFYNALGFASNWYILAGARIEYLFRRSVGANAQFNDAFRTLWFSGDIGAGTEFPLFKKINWFFEYHWNPDVLSHRVGSTSFRNRTFEARLGLVYRPKRRSIDDCNTPKYKGPAY